MILDQGWQIGHGMVNIYKSGYLVMVGAEKISNGHESNKDKNWVTNIEWIDRIFISRGMVIQVGLERITLPIFSVPLQIGLGSKATSHKVQDVAKKSGWR